MTCVAWDGKTLAADKMVSFAAYPRTVTKIFRVHEGLAAISGDGAQGLDMLEWYNFGADPQHFPEAQRDKDQWVHFLVVRADGLWLYERTPVAMKIEDQTFAMGHGRDFAIAAMHLGKTAREAVEIACLFDTTCGMGVDALTLEG